MFMFQKVFTKSIFQLFLVTAFGISLLAYIIYKATHLSFTHDECYTYLHYVHQGFMDIISYKTPYTNNHILNTVLIKYFEELFGNSELVLRMPNVLAFIVYSVYAVLLLYKYAPKLIIPGYLLLTLNPYLLDFFALARGYGLSIGFLVMSIYYICNYFTTLKPVHLILFNVGAFLAVMSNFSLLNYYVAALFTFNAISYIKTKSRLNATGEKETFIKLNKINVISVILSAMVLYEPLRRISKKSLLDFGGKKGFLEDTVGSSIDDLFYETAITPLSASLIKTGIVLVIFLILGIIALKLMKQQYIFFKEQLPLVFMNLTLLLMVVITQIQHIVLGNDFYVHRFALFFYPLFILNFIFCIQYLYTYFKWGSIFMAYGLSVLLSINLYQNHHLNYYKDWKYDKDTKLVMEKLVTEHINHPDKQVQLGINWLFEPSTNFYRYTWDLKWLNPTHRKGINGREDYFYLFKNDKEFSMTQNKESLYTNDETGIILIKNTE